MVYLQRVSSLCLPLPETGVIKTGRTCATGPTWELLVDMTLRREEGEVSRAYPENGEKMTSEKIPCGEEVSTLLLWKWRHERERMSE